ncbi:MFS transporter [Thalassotalea atypica]|uniref:MFS transporter n=1 Tax=Thalassotalea atypica TaxID=2054316 RepID=UPI0025746CD9|nr:MFS transporter [Thalassotalea atypica]
MFNSFFKLSNTYFWYFSVLGLLVPFLAVFLDGKGFNSVEIGEMLAIITATRIFGPTLWAMFADKTGKQLPVIRLGALLAFTSFMLMFLVDSYWGITIALALFSLFWTAILPQLEVMTLASIRRSPKIYARIRLWGSVGFIALAVMASELIERFSSDTFITIGALILFTLWLSTLWHKQPKHIKAAIKPTGSIYKRLVTPTFIFFFLAGLMLQISFGPYYAFFGLLIRQLDYPGYAIGLFISIGVLAEIGIFIIAGRLFQLFSIKTLLIFSILITALRWYLTGNFGDVAIMLVIAQIIHAASFGLYHSASMQFIQQHFASNQQNRGQAIYIGGVYGIGGAIGAYMAGILWLDGAGATNAYVTSASVAIVGAIFALFVSTKNSR